MTVLEVEIQKIEPRTQRRQLLKVAVRSRRNGNVP